VKIELTWSQARLLEDLASDECKGIASGMIHYPDNDDTLEDLTDILRQLKEGAS
jgi:hypothetical protein